MFGDHVDIRRRKAQARPHKHTHMPDIHIREKSRVQLTVRPSTLLANRPISVLRFSRVSKASDLSRVGPSRVK